MFDNMIDQGIVKQIEQDIQKDSLAPSMLFSGPAAAGKATAALELARAIACETAEAPWKCECDSCKRHRLLNHNDLLQLGNRPFSAEIAASAAALNRAPEKKVLHFLFIRALRKLLARFNPILWEDDSKFSKISALTAAIEDDFDNFNRIFSENTGSLDKEAPRKAVNTLVQQALKLESEYIGVTIPIAHVRRAEVWSHLAPVGKTKFLLIENADRMQDSARNSLLKLLEEPPPSLTIVLTSTREEAILPTILSRVRPYRFSARPEESEAEVIRRVFNDKNPCEKHLAHYLESFLPVNQEKVRVASQLLYNGVENRLDPRAVLPQILSTMENFSIRATFSRFIAGFLALVIENAALPASNAARRAAFWQKKANEAVSAVEIYNQNPAIALERFYFY